MLFKRRQTRFLRAFLLLLLVAIALTAVGCSAAPSRGWTGPLVSDNYVYVGTIKGNVVAYDINTREQFWAESLAKRAATGFGCSNGMSTASGIYGTPVLRNDKLYVGAYDGSVLWIAVDGRSVSRSVFETGGKIIGSVFIDGDTLYVGSSDGKLYALDLNAPDLANSLKDGWPFMAGGEIWCSPVVKDDVVYIASADHFLYAIDSESGNEIWRFETEAAIMSTPLVANGRVYVGGCDHNFYSVQAATEDERLAAKAREPGSPSDLLRTDRYIFTAKNWFWTQALPYNGQIWVGSLDGNVYVLDAEDLAYIGEVPTKGMVCAPPVSLAGMVIVGSQDGSIYIIDPDTRDFEAYAVDPKTYDPVKAPEKPKNKAAPILAPMSADEANGMLYFHAQDGYHVLYAFKLSTKEILWHYRTDKVKID